MTRENKMPEMPKTKNVNETLLSSSHASLGEGVSSETPESEKVNYHTPDSDNESNVVVPSKRDERIEVVATRKGFYGQLRRVAGSKFKIASEKDFGDWFTCVDPQMEKARKAYVKKKKAGE